MRIVRLKYKKKLRWGILKDSFVVLLKDSPFQKIVPTGIKIPFNKIKLDVPAQPAG